MYDRLSRRKWTLGYLGVEFGINEQQDNHMKVFDNTVITLMRITRDEYHYVDNLLTEDEVKTVSLIAAKNAPWNFTEKRWLINLLKKYLP